MLGSALEGKVDGAWDVFQFYIVTPLPASFQFYMSLPTLSLYIYHKSYMTEEAYMGIQPKGLVTSEFGEQVN